MPDEVITILKRHRINITKPRQLVLQAFLQTTDSVDYTYFLNTDIFGMDRTTVFRTLNLFVKKNIIYKVPVTDGTNRYLLQPPCHYNSPASLMHFSFVCAQCGKATIIPKEPEVKISLPRGFKKTNIEIVINGLCKACNT